MKMLAFLAMVVAWVGFWVFMAYSCLHLLRALIRFLKS